MIQRVPPTKRAMINKVNSKATTFQRAADDAVQMQEVMQVHQNLHDASNKYAG